MDKIHTRELCSLRGDFDIFIDSPSPDRDCVRRGLLPPLPVRKGELIWGFSHVRTALDLGIDQLRTVEVEGDDVELLGLALRLEARPDDYTLREQAAILDFSRRHGVEHRAEELSPLIRSDGSFQKQARNYLALSEKARELVDSGCLDLKTAGMVSRFPSEVLELLAEITAGYSFSRRRQAFRRVYEIALRDSLADEQILSLVTRIVAEKDPSRALEKLRYPRLTEMNTTFNDISARLLKGSGINLEAPPGFEGDGFDLSFRFTSPRQLGRVIDHLRKLQDAYDELFSLLR